MAGSPLPGARVHLALRYGNDSLVVDTLYVSGSRLRLGTIPTGTPFLIKLSGYDTTLAGTRLILWTGIVSDTAKGANSSLQPVDIQIDTLASPTLDTAASSDPWLVQIPRGSWYTTDGTDPRASDSGGSIHISNGIAIPRIGTVKLVAKQAANAEGDSIWSAVKILTFATTTTPSPLLGTWWRDVLGKDSTRRIVRDELDISGVLRSLVFDPVSLDSLQDSAWTGTWKANDTILQLTLGADSLRIRIKSEGAAYTISYPDGSSGRLTRGKPSASPSDSVEPPDTTTTPVARTLVSSWWEDDTTSVGARKIFLDSLFSDSTFHRQEYDTLTLATTGVRDTGTWRAATGNILLIPTRSLGDSVHLAMNGTDSLVSGDGFKGRFGTTQPMASTPTDPLVGIWWEVSPSWYKFYCDTLLKDRTFRSTVYDTATGLATGETVTGTWRFANGVIRFEYENADPESASVTATATGYVLKYNTSYTSTLKKTPPVFGKPITVSATFWEDDTSAGIRQLFLDTLFSDSSFRRTALDTVTLAQGSSSKGTWKVASGEFLLVVGPGDTIRLDTIAEGSSIVGTALRGRVRMSIPDTSKWTPSLVGSWWEDYEGSTGTRLVFSFDLAGDSTFAMVNHDIYTLDPIDSVTGTWSATGDSLKFVYDDGSSPSVAKYTAVSGGFDLSYPGGDASTVRHTMPPPSISINSDTAWSSAARTSLAGTWWFQTIDFSFSDTLPVAVRYDLAADGTGRRTVFMTWQDSLSDDEIAWAATDTILSVAKGDSALAFTYLRSGDTLHFTDNSYRSWSATRPVLCDSTMVGTWLTTTDSLILHDDSSVEWYWSGSLYTYSWSTREGRLYFYISDSWSPIYSYGYTPGSPTATLYGGDEYTKQP